MEYNRRLPITEDGNAEELVDEIKPWCYAVFCKSLTGGAAAYKSIGRVQTGTNGRGRHTNFHESQRSDSVSWSVLCPFDKESIDRGRIECAEWTEKRGGRAKIGLSTRSTIPALFPQLRVDPQSFDPGSFSLNPAQGHGVGRDATRSMAMLSFGSGARQAPLATVADCDLL